MTIAPRPSPPPPSASPPPPTRRPRTSVTWPGSSRARRRKRMPLFTSICRPRNGVLPARARLREMAQRDTFVVAGREFGSRLLTGTGKYDSFETMRDALAASGSEIVTVAVRRIDLDSSDGDITDFLPEDVL